MRNNGNSKVPDIYVVWYFYKFMLNNLDKFMPLDSEYKSATEMIAKDLRSIILVYEEKINKQFLDDLEDMIELATIDNMFS